MASELNVEELMEEYRSRPPQIAEWLWCIEYVAKFVKDIRCLFEMMKMAYQFSNDFGKRINEVLCLRLLDFLFHEETLNVSEGLVGFEFDLSLSNTHVLREILKEIPVSELRQGMPELSKFKVRPFIAHKKMCLPLCALEKLRDVCLTEYQTSEAPPVNADGSLTMDTCLEEQQNIDDKDKELSINNEDARAKCTKDGVWLINVSDEEPYMANDTCANHRLWRSQRRIEDVCWKCGKGGALLICSGSECASKVHRECLNCEANVDEDGSFHCPVCSYDRAVKEYLDSQKRMISAKRSLVKFMKLLSTRSKRLHEVSAATSLV